MSKPSDAAVIEWMRMYAEPDQREPGWLTAHEIADETGIHYDSARVALERGVRQKAVQKKIVRITDRKGGNRLTTVYFVGATNGKAATAADGCRRRGRGNAPAAPRALPGVRPDPASANTRGKERKQRRS